MIKKIVFATHNNHKAAEVAAILVNNYQVLTLSAIGCLEDIPETGTTFIENANIKSQYVAKKHEIDCFADDSGLEIEALNNEPGVFSARYSGKKDDVANLNLVLKKMEGVTNRNAQFKTIVSLVKNNNTYLFEGIIKGKIRTTPVGNGGFGYDPVFEPEGYTITFAEMKPQLKNAISHRAIAIGKLIAFLKAH